jgi:hypothetical protein
MIKLFVLVMMSIVVLLGLGAPIIYAQYQTYYNPEKRFSIDYMASTQESQLLNITETDNKVGILTNSVGIKVTISPDPQNMDLDEKTVFVQNAFEKQGEGILETTHPIVIDDKIGYSFTLDSLDPVDEDNDLISTFIYVIHNGNIYQFMIYETMIQTINYPERVDHIIESIKFFS